MISSTSLSVSDREGFILVTGCEGMIQALPEDTVLGQARQPPDESNVGQSALLLPLSRISEDHRGRKIRTTGQYVAWIREAERRILAYDMKTSLLLLAAQPTGRGPIATLLVDLKVPLLDCPNPAITDIPLHDYTFAPAPRTPQTAGLVNRERLRIERGCWVCVVGWLEGELAKRPKSVRKLQSDGLSQSQGVGSYAPPLEVVLEAIHISNARPAPNGAVHRGDLPPVASHHAAADDTPRPRTRIQAGR